MPKKVRAEIVQPVTLEDSFDIVLNRLTKFEQDMMESNKRVYQAVGKFAGTAMTTAQAMADIAIDEAESSTDELTLGERLQNRLCLLRSEADALLLAAHSDEEIDRVLRLEHLIDRISCRIATLAQVMPDSSADKTAGKSNNAATDLAAMTKAQLCEMAKIQGLKGYSKLKKHELVDLLAAAKNG